MRNYFWHYKSPRGEKGGAVHQESELVEVVVGDEKEPRLDIRLQKVIQRTLYRILRQQTNLRQQTIKRANSKSGQPWKSTNPIKRQPLKAATL